MSCSTTVYATQEILDIDFYFGDDITGQTLVHLKYSDPNAATGFFVATVIEETTGHCRYTIAAPLGVVGTWTFWGEATISGSKIQGAPFTLEVKAEGT